MEQQFLWVMIFFGAAVVVVLILMFALGWNNKTTNIQEEVVSTSQAIPRDPPVNKDTKSFSKTSVQLLNGFFQSIDNTVSDTNTSNEVETSANELARMLCDSTNQTLMVKSYLNLNDLLKKYTKIKRSEYVEKSDFSLDRSGIVDRSMSDSLCSLQDIKSQAGLLTMIIDNIYVKCLDLSAKSNENFKTYLNSINTMLFAYSELVAQNKWDEAKKIKAKAISIASGAILSSKSE